MNRLKATLVGGALGACLFSAPTVRAQTSNDDLKKDIETLKEGMKGIQKELQEIKALLQGRMGPPPSVVLDLGNNPFKGEKTAKLTLVEFSDYQ